MRVIQTLRMSGKKLALVFTTLTTALVMSTTAQVSALYFYGADWNLNYNTAYNVGWKATHVSPFRECNIDLQVGRFWSAAYAQVQITQRSHDCSVVVHMLSGNQWTVSPTVTNSINYWAQTVGQENTYPQIVKFYVATTPDCYGAIYYQHNYSGVMTVYNSYHYCYQ